MARGLAAPPSRCAPATEGGFEVTLADGTTAAARRLLLATGVTDQLPAIDGLAKLWGRGVYHCPYCDGWEAREQEVAVLGGDDQAAHLALHLARLGCEVTVCSNGPVQASGAARAALAAHHISVCEDPVGSATLTTLLSRVVMNVASDTAASVHQRVSRRAVPDMTTPV